MGDEATRESSALRGTVPAPTSSEEITVPIAVEAMAELVESERRESTPDEHAKDSIALERGIKPIEP